MTDETSLRGRGRPGDEFARQEARERRQAQFLASLILFLLPLGWLITVLPVWLDGGSLLEDPEAQLMAGMTLFAVVMYGFSRSRHYRITALLVVLVCSLSVFVAALPDDPPADYMAFLYLSIPILASSMFLSVRLTLAIIAADIAGMLLFPLIVDGVSFDDIVIGPLRFLLLASTAIVLAAHYRNRIENDRLRELEKALASVRVLRGLLPICMTCKRIRDDRGYWKQLEVYIRDHSEAEFSHGVCPECASQLGAQDSA